MRAGPRTHQPLGRRLAGARAKLFRRRLDQRLVRALGAGAIFPQPRAGRPPFPRHLSAHRAAPVRQRGDGRLASTHPNQFRPLPALQHLVRQPGLPAGRLARVALARWSRHRRRADRALPRKSTVRAERRVPVDEIARGFFYAERIVFLSAFPRWAEPAPLGDLVLPHPRGRAAHAFFRRPVCGRPRAGVVLGAPGGLAAARICPHDGDRRRHRSAPAGHLVRLGVRDLRGGRHARHQHECHDRGRRGRGPAGAHGVEPARHPRPAFPPLLRYNPHRPEQSLGLRPGLVFPKLPAQRVFRLGQRRLVRGVARAVAATDRRATRRAPVLVGLRPGCDRAGYRDARSP
jgi:hypothetical protein